MIVMAAITTVLLAACTADNRTATPSTRPPSSRAVRTPTAGACTTAQVRDLVNQFVRAFNLGDQRALQQLWAQQGDGFDWYSTDAPGQRILAAAKDRVGLVHYFNARHAAGESLRLTSFQFNGNSAAYGNFQYTLIRRANDLTATAYTGKGAAICAPNRSTLGVWSMAKDPRSRPTTPPPPGTPQATNTSTRWALTSPESTASRDLRDLVTAGVFIAKGEKRGRSYVPSPKLLALRQEATEQSGIPRDDSDPFAAHAAA